MKRTIIYLITSLLLTLPSGCGKHSVPEVDAQTGQYIFFDAGVGQTKGALVEGEALPAAAGTAFGVFGFRSDGTTPVFNRYKVSPTDGYVSAVYDNVAKVYRPSADDLFTYDALSVWRTGSHSFYAYYPYEQSPAVLQVVTTGENAPYITYAQPTSLDDMVDVMTATATDVNSGTNGVVDLTFNHRLFALDVVVKNSQTESNREIKLTSATIKFIDLASSATMKFDETTNPGSSKTTISHTYPIESGGQTITNGQSLNLNENDSFLLIPCASLSAEITLTIINAWGETVPFTLSQTVKPKSGNFLAGNKYELLIEKNDKDVNFVLDVSGWTQADVGMEFN